MRSDAAVRFWGGDANGRLNRRGVAYYLDPGVAAGDVWARHASFNTLYATNAALCWR
jgi:hypothetical protein